MRVLDGQKANKAGTEINHTDCERTLYSLMSAQHLCLCVCSVKAGYNHGSVLNSC